MPREGDPIRPGELDRVFHSNMEAVLLWTAGLLAFFALAMGILGLVVPDAVQGLKLVALALLAASPVMAWAVWRGSAVRVTRTGIAAADMRGKRMALEWRSIEHVRRIRALGFDYVIVGGPQAPRDAWLDTQTVLRPEFRNACEVAGPDHPMNVFIRAESGRPNRPADSIVVLLEAMFGEGRPGTPDDSGEVIRPTRDGRVKLAIASVVGGGAWLANELWSDDFFRYVRSLPDCAQMPYWLAFWLVLASVFVFASFVCARRGMRILRSGQSPPPDTWVFFTTRVRRGRAATLSACGQFAIAAFFGLLVVGLCFVVWWFGMVDAVQQCASS